MDVTRPKEIADLFRRRGFSPRKSWGQNFLVNREVVAKLIAAAQLTGCETVLEIGPGLGVMTEPLLAKAAKVVAVEIDPLLCQFLSHRFLQRENFHLVKGDALDQDFSLLFSEPYIVANLPYNISSPLLLETHGTAPHTGNCHPQWEVARRLTAHQARDYGALTFDAVLCHGYPV